MESPCCLSHRQVKKHENLSIHANINEERRARKSTGGGEGEIFSNAQYCCERHVVLDVHLLLLLLFLFIFFYVSVCLYMWSFQFALFPVRSEEGWGGIVILHLRICICNDFHLGHRSQVSSKLQLQRYPLSIAHASTELLLWRALSLTRKNKEKGILHCGSE